MKISRLVTGVKGVSNASISPDGKYVAYAVNQGETVSLHLRQISTGSDREIVAPVANANIDGPSSRLIASWFTTPFDTETPARWARSIKFR